MQDKSLPVRSFISNKYSCGGSDLYLLLHIGLGAFPAVMQGCVHGALTLRPLFYYTVH